LKSEFAENKTDLNIFFIDSQPQTAFDFRLDFEKNGVICKYPDTGHSD